MWQGFLRISTYINGYNTYKNKVKGNSEGEGRLLGGKFKYNFFYRCNTFRRLPHQQKRNCLFAFGGNLGRSSRFEKTDSGFKESVIFRNGIVYERIYIIYF